ncbi:MAG: efflux RND transporter periplasmic adaptor subunit [Deltaproteobacteria bacterium]|nr:efflux RND transporter periplasmic adaptor subunit [Deltaproteobacteria bacterium]
MKRIITCMFAASLLLSACSGTTGDGVAGRTVPVKVAAAAKGSITKYAHVSGTTQALHQAKVGSKVEGVIKEILADQGSAVQKGQVLVRLEPQDFTLAVDLARAGLQQAEHDLVQQAQDWKRISNLYERRVIPKHRYDAMQAAHGIARGRVDEAKAALGLAQRKFEDSVVRAPFDGVVTAKMMHEGEVSSLWAYKWEVLEIMDLTSIKLECDVSEKLKAQVREGMQAEVKLDAYPDATFTGSIAVVNPLVEPAQRTFRIKILISNPDSKLTAGMFARIRIALDRRDNVLVIPARDILERPDGHFIFVVKDGAAEQRQISLGARDNQTAEVTAGLKEGEIVVTEGSHRLQNGYKVDIKS